MYITVHCIITTSLAGVWSQFSIKCYCFLFRNQVDQYLTGTGVVKAVTKDLTSLTEEFHTIVLPFVKQHANIFP